MTASHFSHKRLKAVQGATWAELGEKKYNKDRTEHERTGQQKSQKRNISHIWGKALRKGIAMKFGAVVDIHEVVTWAEFDLENLRDVDFTVG